MHQITVFYGTSAASEAMPPHSGSKLAQAIKDLKTSRPLVKRTRDHVARAYQHAHLLMQVPRIVYVRQGDPGTEEFIASMIESPVQRKLGLGVGLLA